MAQALGKSHRNDGRRNAKEIRTAKKGDKTMSNFIWCRDRYVNADHIVIVRECKSSFDYGSELVLDITNSSGMPVVVLAEPEPEKLIDIICGREDLL